MSETYRNGYCYHCNSRTMFEDNICTHCGRSMFGKGEDDEYNRINRSLSIFHRDTNYLHGLGYPGGNEAG